MRLILVDVESGTIRERSEYQVLCAGILTGEISELWFYRVDRLGRDHYELVNFLYLVETTGCRIVSICEPFVERWQESSWAFRAMWDAIGDARYELLRLKERQKDGIKAKQVAVTAGRTPWHGRGPDRRPRKRRL